MPIPRSIPSRDADHEFLPQALAFANRGTKMIGSAVGSIARVAAEKLADVGEQGKKVVMSTASGQILEAAYNKVRHRQRLKGRIRALANNK